MRKFILCLYKTFNINPKIIRFFLRTWKKSVLLFNMIDNKFVRLMLLFLAGGFGLMLGKYADVQFFSCYLGESNRKVAEYLATVVVGVPIFIFLWYYRTRDVRQQIEKIQEQIQKSQKQIDQNHFNNAIGNLTSDILIKEEVGVQSLIKLSEVTPEFNELIIIAFRIAIDRFKSYIIGYESYVRNRDQWPGTINNSNDESLYGDRAKYMSRTKLIDDIKGWLEAIKAKEKKEQLETMEAQRKKKSMKFLDKVKRFLFPLKPPK